MFRLHFVLSLTVLLSLAADVQAQDGSKARDLKSKLQSAARKFEAAADSATRAPASRDARSQDPRAGGRQRIPQNNPASSAGGSPLARFGVGEPSDITPSGRYLVAASPGGGLLLCDVAGGRRLRALENSQQAYSLVKISPNARWIAAVRQKEPERIDIWRADNGRLVRTIAAASGAKRSLEFTSQGDELRVLGDNGQGVVYNVASGATTGGFGIANGGSSRKAPRIDVAPPTAPRTGAGRFGGPSLAPRAPAAAAPSDDTDDEPIAEPFRSESLAAPSAPAGQPDPSKSAVKSRTGAMRSAPAPELTDIAAPAPEPTLDIPAPTESSSDSAPSFAAPISEPTFAPAMAAPNEPGMAAPSEPAMSSPAYDAPEPTLAKPQAGAIEDDAFEPPAAAPMAAPPATARMMRSAPAAAPESESDEVMLEDAEPRAGAAAPAAPRSSFMVRNDEPAPDGRATPEAASPASDASVPPAPGAALPEASAALAMPQEDLSSVTVHYATNRNRLEVGDRLWLTYFRNFFGSLPAFVVYAVVLVAVLVFPWIGKRSWATVAMVSGALVLCAMASLEAYVRSQLRDELSGEVFGARATDLSYGTCKVSVPKPENRQAGELNRPLSVWILEAPENPEKHFTLQKLTEHADKDEFYHSLSNQLAKSADGVSLLFIHGYNVSFEDAIFRTAQLAVDLKFPGAPITFSWPSYADPLKYTFDEQNAEVSIPALREVLEDLAKRSGAKRIHIIAHSMGNRVLAGALRSMPADARPVNREMFREVVLAAPDIDSRVFKTQFLPHIGENAQHCTLYASNRDRALMMSRYFHNFQRLGETEPELIVASGMDTIDASLVDTSLLGHSYIGDVQSIVSDLRDLVVRGMRPKERLGLETLLMGNMMYWTIKPMTQASVPAEATQR